MRRNEAWGVISQAACSGKNVCCVRSVLGPTPDILAAECLLDIRRVNRLASAYKLRQKILLPIFCVKGRVPRNQHHRVPSKSRFMSHRLPPVVGCRLDLFRHSRQSAMHYAREYLGFVSISRFESPDLSMTKGDTHVLSSVLQSV